MLQDILDAGGNIIGQLEFPDGTSQDAIDEALVVYTFVPIVPTLVQQVSISIQAATMFGQSLMRQYAAENVLMGITPAGLTPGVAAYLQTLVYYLTTGSLYAAMGQMNTMIADTSTTKTSLSPYVTNARLYTYLNLIQTYLNIPLTTNPGS